MAKSEYVCEYCVIKFYRYPSTVTGKHTFCSIECKSKWQSENCSGENNSNFGKEWSRENKSKQSELIKLKMTDQNIRYKVGSANRGKKFSKDRIQAMHGHRSKSSYSRPHSTESKKKIGDTSKNKWTLEYKERNRKIREAKGSWIPLDKLSAYDAYFRESEWSKTLNSYIDKNDI